jgi:hypothetical protein
LWVVEPDRQGAGGVEVVALFAEPVQVAGVFGGAVAGGGGQRAVAAGLEFAELLVGVAEVGRQALPASW